MPMLRIMIEVGARSGPMVGRSVFALMGGGVLMLVLMLMLLEARQKRLQDHDDYSTEYNILFRETTLQFTGYILWPSGKGMIDKIDMGGMVTMRTGVGTPHPSPGFLAIAGSVAV
ncbi:hypothetical protein EX30DRAFT_372806 [Ascodesmis nigricans]|uniref:Uncharacterized protein n=1 Tax=Ascodesmis nigricans TaxID=341454 RepID=A0A4S2MTH4_9PEZI|nr:hypothetical protein EX30DRAFT_372806 [Ascodesmis nigricans]